MWWPTAWMPRLRRSAAATPRSSRAGRASCRCSISACCGPRSWSTSTAFRALPSSARTRRAIRIGALTRHHQLETSPVIARHLPVLAEAMTHVAHLAIRNRGTIGGSLSHADPGRRAADDGDAARCRAARRVGIGNADGRGARLLPRRAVRRPRRGRDRHRDRAAEASAGHRLGISRKSRAAAATSRSPRLR